MATHSSTLALKIPWTEELGAGYYPWGLKESGTTSLSLSISLWAFPWLSGKESASNAEDPGSIPGSGRSPGEGHGYPLQYSCLESMNRGAWWAAVLLLLLLSRFSRVQLCATP